MTELLSDIETPSDAELISRVRGGDVAAYGELFSRHVEAANRLGRQLARGPDVDDLVSEAFAKVLQVLQGGGGPDVAFRAYLLTSVRRLHVDRVRASSKLQTSDDMTEFDPGIPFQDTAVADFENGAAAKAFASLPERWQLVLWHLEVEGQKPVDIAPLLGMSPNSVSALAYRAREGLRQAFLTMHLADISAEDCRWVNEHLGAYVRKGLSRRDTTKVESHLDECRRCMAMYLELTEVNSNLAGIIAPLLLGAVAASYCASTGTAAGLTGVSAIIGRARDFVAANAGASTAGAVAAGVAAVATAGVMVLGPDTARVISADEPFSDTTSLPNTAPLPADPPVEVEERTAPERDEPRDDRDAEAAAEDEPVDDSADVAGDVLDPVAPVDPAAPVVPPAAGEGDGGPGEDPAGQPGNTPGDGPGGDSPGQGGPDGPGPDQPGAPGPGDPGTPGGPGSGGPGDDPAPDGPGTDEPVEQPGTEQPGTDEPGEQPDTDGPTAPPGPGPEENPNSDDEQPGGSPDEDPSETPGEGDPPGGGEGTPGEGDGSPPSDGNDTPSEDETPSDDPETPPENSDGTPPDDEETGGYVGVTLDVTVSQEDIRLTTGANVLVPLVLDLPAGTVDIVFSVTLAGDEIAIDSETCQAPVADSQACELEFKVPVGSNHAGDDAILQVTAVDATGQPVAPSVYRPVNVPEPPPVSAPTEPGNGIPATSDNGQGGKELESQDPPDEGTTAPILPTGDSGGNALQQVVDAVTGLL